MDDLQASGTMDKELQEFLAQEQQKMQFQAQVRTFGHWDVKGKNNKLFLISLIE